MRRGHCRSGELKDGARQEGSMQRINLDEKFGLFTEQWRPKVIAAANGQEVKIVKVQGEFPWHHHTEEDEFFMVWKGRFRVEFRDHAVELGPGECVVVPRGIEHRTCADQESEILLIEPTGVINTGNVTDAEFTAPTGVAI
jgi:mannose-6-phosphate isomerase-like protein (cupin superfamily)